MGAYLDEIVERLVQVADSTGMTYEQMAPDIPNQVERYNYITTQVGSNEILDTEELLALFKERMDTRLAEAEIIRLANEKYGSPDSMTERERIIYSQGMQFGIALVQGTLPEEVENMIIRIIGNTTLSYADIGAQTQEMLRNRGLLPMTKDRSS